MELKRRNCNKKDKINIFKFLEAPIRITNFNPTRNNAFTLAEVLITLGIIGIVAALTIPSLIGKYREKQTVNAVKTAYSIFSQAYLRLTEDYPDLSQMVDENATPKERAQFLLKELTKYIKTIRRCDQDKYCMGEKYISLSGKPLPQLDNLWDKTENIETGALANGMTFWVLSENDKDGEFAGQLGIDINGNKKPNQMGVDFFWFTVDKHGVVTAGRRPKTRPAGIYYNCDMNNINTTNYNGYGCAEWLLEHENMDYLRKQITTVEKSETK